MSGRSGSAKRRMENGPPAAACPPKLSGAICTETFGSSFIASRWSSWARSSSGPLSERRSAASSMTAQSVGAPGAVSTSWRRIRSSTRRSTSSASSWPSRVTARA